MEGDSPNVFAVLNMKREQQQEKRFLLAVLEVFLFFSFVLGFLSSIHPFIIYPLYLTLCWLSRAAARSLPSSVFVFPSFGLLE